MLWLATWTYQSGNNHHRPRTPPLASPYSSLLDAHHISSSDTNWFSYAGQSPISFPVRKIRTFTTIEKIDPNGCLSETLYPYRCVWSLGRICVVFNPCSRSYAPRLGPCLRIMRLSGGLGRFGSVQRTCLYGSVRSASCLRLAWDVWLSAKCTSQKMSVCCQLQCAFFKSALFCGSSWVAFSAFEFTLSKQKHTFLKNLLNVFHCWFALLTRGEEDGLKSFVNSGDNTDCSGEVVERFILLKF